MTASGECPQMWRATASCPETYSHSTGKPSRNTRPTASKSCWCLTSSSANRSNARTARRSL